MPRTKRFLIIDSNALLHRAYHALPPLKTKKGEILNAVYGFLLVFLKAIKELKPDFVAAAFDFPSLTFRHQEFKEYKAKRVKAPDELYEQIPKAKEVLRIFGVPVFEKKGFEADDIIGTLTCLSKKHPQLETVILTGDMDVLQLIDDKTRVYALKRGIKDTLFYDQKEVEKRYSGLSPSQLLDVKSLQGDASDNIPGVPGIGEKTAVSLIKKFKSVENLYQEIERNSDRIKEIKKSVLEKLKKNKEQAFLSKKLAEIKKDVGLEFDLKKCIFKPEDKEKIIELFSRLEFHTLLKRIEEMFFKGKGKRFEKENLVDLKKEIEKLEKQGILSKKLALVEKKLIGVVLLMEENGIRIEKEKIKKLSQELENEIKLLEQKIYEMAGVEFNLNSPVQLSQVLFERLKIPSDLLKKTPKGAISTGASELQKLRGFYPIIDLILRYRELFKLKSGFIDALPKLINPKDNRIHPHFHQLGTETGRMSCSNPNLQNIPVKGEWGKKIRSCFVPEKGFVFVSADYSQMELRIAACLSRDRKMIDFFKKGGDVHKFVASQIFNMPEDEVGDDLRSFAKTLSFGILYGMGAWGLAERTGVSLEKARGFIDEFFNDFSGIAQYVKEVVEKVKKQGYAETLFGRKRFLPEINSKDKRMREAAERMAINMGPQGTAADILKMAMVDLKEKRVIDRKCRLLLQIHDELLFEVKKNVVEAKAREIKEIMENVIHLEVPLVVEIKKGENWGEMGRIKL